MLAFALFLAACVEEVEPVALRCEVDLIEARPAAAAVGEEVALVGRPLTEHWDTSVTVGGVPAEVLGLARSGCSPCDSCREINACTACSDCDDCDLQCEQDCEESVRILVPEAPAGTAEIRITNSHGSGGPLAFEITATDTAGGDSADTSSGR